jgi:predicted nuclease of predicted toxin-antitoxin system
MPRTIRFHLDEHVDPAIADGVRRRGINVTTTAGVGMIGASDDEHVAFAQREGRVIVTFDDDYLSAVVRNPGHHGIAYKYQGNRNIGHMIRSLELIWELLEIEEMVGRVEYL